jgi:hypothetical protein
MEKMEQLRQSVTEQEVAETKRILKDRVMGEETG